MCLQHLFSTNTSKAPATSPGTTSGDLPFNTLFKQGLVRTMRHKPFILLRAAKGSGVDFTVRG